MLTYNNVSVRYGNLTVLEDISFNIKKGEFTAILGKNGSGKSTLVSCCIDAAKYDGDILLNGEPLSKLSAKDRAHRVALLPQQLEMSSMSVFDLVSLGRNPYISLFGRMSKADINAVNDAISAMGLSHLRDRCVSSLSGGECRKAYVAMILTQNTDIVILDEPTAFMDVCYISEFMSTLMKLKNDYGKTLIVVSHDINTVCDCADRIIVLDDKKICFDGRTRGFVNSDIPISMFNLKRVNYTEDGQTKVLFK